MTGPTTQNGEQPSSVVLLERHAEQGVGVITLNRPNRRNALGHEMLIALDGAISELSADDSVSAIILTGAGESFCSGVDTSELTGGSAAGPHMPGPGGPEALRLGFELARRIILVLFDVEKPLSPQSTAQPSTPVSTSPAPAKSGSAPRTPASLPPTSKSASSPATAAYGFTREYLEWGRPRRWS